MEKQIAKKTTLVVILLVFFVIQSFGQFQLDAEFRPRFELRNGYKKLQSKGEIPSLIISQRTRLSFVYENKNVKLTITPQDVRVWGDEKLTSSTGVYGDAASLDLHEAYAEIMLGQKTKISIGRQELAYDNERLLSKRNWNQHGLSYDAVVLKHRFKGLDLHAAASWNSQTETLSNNYFNPSHIKSLNFLWINKTFKNKQKLSFLHIASGQTDSLNSNRLFFKQSSGLYTSYKGKRIAYRANIYYQYGKNNENQKISAFLGDIDASYNMKKASLGLGVSYLSGNKNLNSNTYQLFDVLYGARHKYFGHMDYFSNIPSSTKEGGLFNPYAYLGFTLSEKIKIKNSLHYFQLAQTNQNTPENKPLGFENEIEFSYAFSEWGSVKVAYLFFLPTENLKTMQGINNEGFNQFAFVEISLKPNLFSSKTE
jgi:hypothetical protein